MDMVSKTYVGKCPFCGGNNYKKTYTSDKDNPMKFHVEHSCVDCDAFEDNVRHVSEEEYQQALVAKGLLDKTEE